MAHTSADVLILRTVKRGENDCLVTGLCKDGRIHLMTKGASSIRRREPASTEPFTWSNMEIYDKNGFKWIKSATALNSFAGIRYDMDKLFLSAYIADVAYELSDEGEPAGEILPLVLNTLHTLATCAREDVARVKAAFEIRAACIAGFAPDLTTCTRCHAHVEGDAYLDVMNGALVCRACFERAQTLLPIPQMDGSEERRLLLPLDASSLAALAFVVGADAKRVFAFRVSDTASLTRFGSAAESYLLNHLERGFESLENYKKLASFAPLT